ncbi:hypothetical protein BSTP6_003 [Bacillus phage BSTP6]|uniref:Uncharacterized protein n=1 Tax=Bacillus phage BSTP6 TaxID=2801531 RepID=A0A889IQ02_9CAUD|nr:hypothetical protein BSTP6_003 [Bacillus phage BSTP6]
MTSDKEGYIMKRAELEEHIANMFKDGTIKLQVHPFGTNGIHLIVEINDQIVLEWEN